MSFALVHCAGNMFQPTRKRVAAYAAAVSNADVATFTEAQKDHAAIQALGFGSAILVELAIVWNRARFDKVDQGGAKVMDGGKHGAGLRIADRRRRGPNRYVLWVVLHEKSTGQDWLIAVHHAIAKPDTSFLWRRRLHTEGLKNAAAEIRKAQAKHPGAQTVIDGDWNRKGAVSFGLGLTEVKTPPTFGKLRYDRVQTDPDVRATGVRTFATGLDHKAIAVRLSAMGSVPKPPPTPKPEPAPKPENHMPATVAEAIAAARKQSHEGPAFGINECKMRCRLLYGVPSDGANTAAIAWGRTKFKHKVTRLSDIPRGALIWWTGGSSGAGHVAVSAGKGRCWSTDIKRKGHFDNVPIGLISKSWPKVTLAGWSEDIDGVRVIHVGTGAPSPAPVPTPAPSPTPAPRKGPAPKAKPDLAGFRPRVDGVDLSHHQGRSLNFAKAKAAGVKFVYHKVSEANTFRDPGYSKRRAEVGKAGIPFGGYHFARPGSSSGTVQAQKFLTAATPKPGDLRPCLDLEDKGGLNAEQLTVWVEQFVAEVEKATGKPPVVYMPSSFVLTRDVGCYLWVPRYSNTNALPVIPKPWDRWTIWQFSNGVFGSPKSVDGIGHCDINVLQPGFDLSHLIL